MAESNEIDQMQLRQKASSLLLLTCILTQLSFAIPPRNDVVIVGAGIAGLGAALESARRGAQVVVIDISTVGGGHAIVSNGAVSLVNTPLQQQKGIADSPQLAKKDFLRRGEDADVRWVDLYATKSKTQIYDWLIALGVKFDTLGQPPGNSVPRLHFTHGKGWGLIGPLYRECLRYPNIRFVWATKAEKLVIKDGAVVGVSALDLRSGKHPSFLARNVIIATGGFGSNLQLIRDNWSGWLPRPDRLLAGASPTALGSGLEIVEDAGGAVSRLDHQWNYVLGLPDPDDPQQMRGLASFGFRSIWVNRHGKRFTQEFGDPKINLSDLLHQTDKTYWSIFDSDGVDSFSITLAGWENQQEVNQLVFRTQGVSVKANSFQELASKAGISPQGLIETIRRYNYFVARDNDEDFHVFGPGITLKPHAIEKPPFYAVQFFPITRKTMGGVMVDTECRVLNRKGAVIPGLFAVGEVTGFGGINGKAALEGTFLGPGILMGRIAGRKIASHVQRQKSDILRPLPQPRAPGTFSNEACLRCHDLPKQMTQNRAGFWHFEQAHKKVLARKYECAGCHQDLYPFDSGHHQVDSLELANSCVKCHGVQNQILKSDNKQGEQTVVRDVPVE